MQFYDWLLKYDAQDIYKPNVIMLKRISPMGTMCASSLPINYVALFQLDALQLVTFEAKKKKKNLLIKKYMYSKNWNIWAVWYSQLLDQCWQIGGTQ